LTQGVANLRLGDRVFGAMLVGKKVVGAICFSEFQEGGGEDAHFKGFDLSEDEENKGLPVKGTVPS